MEGLCAVLFNNIRRKRQRRRRRQEVKEGLGMSHHHEGVRTLDVMKENKNYCQFSNGSDLCLSIVTWNMNGRVCYEDIRKLIVSGDNQKFDMLVVGLQEVPRQNVSKILNNVLVDTHTLVGKAIMQSLQLYIFGPKDSQRFIREVKVDKHSIGGFGGLIRRKKGAVAVRINYKGIRILFVSCHLAAHARNVEERNDQFREITNSLFSQNLNPYARPTHLTIWLGDLNYRLQGISSFPARDMIHDDLHQMLRENDQLLQEAERGQIFNGYYEGTLAFKPTYKYNIGSSNYDTSYKVRVPSWTDRILFKIEDHSEINATLHSYESIDNIHSSDHKPVKAHLCLKFQQNH